MMEDGLDAGGALAGARVLVADEAGDLAEDSVGAGALVPVEAEVLDGEAQLFGTSLSGRLWLRQLPRRLAGKMRRLSC